MNTRKCDRCHRTVIAEEFDNHDCHIVSWDTQEIGITCWFEGRVDENGDKVLIAQGLNGILYRLVECDHNPPHPETRPTVFDSRKIRLNFSRADLLHDDERATGDTKPFHVCAQLTKNSR